MSANYPQPTGGPYDYSIDWEDGDDPVPPESCLCHAEPFDPCNSPECKGSDICPECYEPAWNCMCGGEDDGDMPTLGDALMEVDGE